MDLDPGGRVDPACQRLRCPVEADHDRRQGARPDPAVGVMLDGARQAGRRAEDPDDSQVVEHNGPAVDEARPGRDADVDHPPGRLDQRQGGGRNPVIAGAVDDRVIRARQRLPGGPVPAGPERRRELPAARVHRQHVDLRACGDGEGDGQQPDRARSADQDAPPRSRLRGPHGALGVAAGLDEGAGPVVDGRGQPVQAGHGHQHLVGQRARPGRDPDLVTIRADVPVAGQTAVAATAAEHGVGRDADAQPRLVDVRADPGDDAAPLVPRTEWEARLPLLEIGELPGEQLDVGPADPDPVHVDYDLTRGRTRDLDLADPGRPGAVDNQRPHHIAHALRIVSSRRVRAGG